MSRFANNRSTGAVCPLALAVHMLAAGAAFTATPASAQQPEPAQTEELAPITVTGKGERRATTEGTASYTTEAARTATPLSMSLRETPQSVTVVTQQRIEDQDMQTILDVVNNTVGVSVNRYETSRAQFNARGFEINALMIDGVPTIWEQPWSSGEMFSSLAMYDRVEVVRGANGLMSGSGDPSASLNLVRKRASSAHTTGSLEVSGGTWDTYGVLGDVAFALNDAGSVRARLVGEYNDADSWIDLHTNQRSTLYGTMDIDLTPDTTLWFGMSHQENKSDSPMWGGLPYWYHDGSKTDWDRSKTTSTHWSKWNTTYETRFINLDHSFANDWNLHLGYNRGERDGESYLFYVYTYASQPGSAPINTYPAMYKTRTVQEDYSVRLDGPFSLFNRDHELAFGYIHSEQKFDADTRFALTGWGGIPDFDSYEGDFPEPTWSPLTTYGEGDLTQTGAYAATRLNLADDLKLILGVRDSTYKKKADDIYSDPTRTDVGHELTPYAGIIYDLNNTFSVYASYTDIFQPQTERDRNGQQIVPIIGKSYEAGLKGEFYDGRLNASIAVFRIEQDNLAADDPTITFIPGTTETAYIASEATSKGFELEVNGELADGWNIGAGYTQFKIEDANGDAANTRFPTKLLRSFTTYQFPGEWSRLTVGGGVNWQDDIYTYAPNPAGNAEKIEQQAYALVNAMARYQISDNLAAQVNANNLTDEKYFDIFEAFGAITYGAPRSVTLSAKYRF
ncbi:TonB-dependent siderophore receptor [Halopseudomonas maritima]|uniref:TonB-dependent siderophore receptor n=1 Tax=Halopseudomonas maritima TaxID=2918528 RepID=UPI001EEB469C|nr:TonB-dependent siderophore receptor [Halopseudomonas maritima]UJJ32506.1 TonB-dependent siderophore receptor [Halopseudomonas maritima]